MDACYRSAKRDAWEPVDVDWRGGVTPRIGLDARDLRGPGRHQARDPARRPPQADPQGPRRRATSPIGSSPASDRERQSTVVHRPGSADRGLGEEPAASTRSVRSELRVSVALSGQVHRRRAGADRDRAGLDDPAVVRPDVRELLGREPEGHGPPLAGLERDPPEAAQLEDRPGDRRLVVADVQLDDLVASDERRCSRRRRCTVTSPPSVGTVGPVESQVRDLERRVGQAEPERPERRARTRRRSRPWAANGRRSGDAGT